MTRRKIELTKGSVDKVDFEIPWPLALLHVQCFKLDEVRGEFTARPMMKMEHRLEVHRISEELKKGISEYQRLDSSPPRGLLSNLRSKRWQKAREQLESELRASADEIRKLMIREQYDEMNEEEWYIISFESESAFYKRLHPSGVAFAVSMRPSVFEKARAFQREEPVYLGVRLRHEEGEPEGKVWWYGDKFWISSGYSEEEARLLVWEKGRREQRKIERLEKAMAAAREGQEEARRERIPEEVRLLVWERDGGRCVKCGSTEDLEFDHIIPVSKGGSSTEKNVQLLCATCNREKRDSIL